MNSGILLMAGVDLVAILVLITMYFMRHRRRDLIVSYLVINVGIFAVAVALSNAGATTESMGMGLFGVLSIIRLRSTELDQREVAYYFCSLALGLLTGIGLNLTLTAVLIALVLLVMGISDSSQLMATMRSQIVTVDRAISDEEELRAYLSVKLGYQIASANIQQLDLINDKTIVDIRYTTVPSRNRHERLVTSR